MSKVLVFAFIVLTGLVAEASDFECVVSVNLSEVARAELQLPKRGQVAVAYVASEDVEISIKAIDDRAYELEVFDRIAPTRSYARATLAQAGDRIGYSDWQRDRLFEVDCRLN